MNKHIVLLAAAVVGIAGPAAAQEILGGATASVALSIGVKNDLRQSDVDFEVVQPTGDHSRATAKAPYNGERPGTVTYPSDFTNAGMHSGTYKWVARIRGKVVASGTFKYVPSKAGLQTFTP